MPPRLTPPAKGSFYPPNDAATYRDLLLFEERLKTNAASLQRRKSRYQLFLVQLLIVIAFLLSEVLLPSQSSILVIPYKLVLQRLLPNVYTPDTEVVLHPYFASGLLFVSVTTLVLFFASGMYSEKIGYANKYVPQANRALRSFNMYLNVRKPPLRSKIYFNPLAFFFPRLREPPSSASNTSISPSSPSAHSSNASQSRSTSVPIPPIPPATNPRGELIFSSRVDKNFREAYERYRAAFERKREERERLQRGRGWLGKLAFWDRTPSSSGAGAYTGTTTPSAGSSRGRGSGSRSGTPPAATGTMMMRQRSTSPGTPPTSRQTSTHCEAPIPGKASGLARQGSGRGRRDAGGDGNMRALALEKSLGLGTL